MDSDRLDPSKVFIHHEESNSSSYSQMEDKIAKVQPMPLSLPRRNLDDAKFRGFSTSIAQSFVNVEDQKAEMCSYVCCGILQRDRNRFLLSRLPPPSFTKRVWTFLIAPLFLLAIAYYIFFNMDDIPYNDWLALGILSLLVFHVVVQAIKAYRKRVTFRQELLWRKFCRDGSISPHPSELDVGNHAYMMGQTEEDFWEAHGLCGCYNDDLGPDSKAEQSSDLCSCVWRLYKMLCCGSYYWQCCGVCAVSQEARDLDSLVADHRRRIDYVTMQPVLEYYYKILDLRQRANNTFLDHWRALSKLSIQLCQGLLLLLAMSVLLCLFLGTPLFHIYVVAGVFGYTLLTLWIFHWPWNKHNISLDLVIKAFAAGLCLATTMAMLVEGIEALLVRGSTEAILFGLNHWGANQGNDDNYGGDDVYNSNAQYGDDGGNNANGDDAYGNDGYADDYNVNNGASLIEHAFSQQLAGDFKWLYIIYLFFHAFLVSAFVEEVSKYLTFKMTTTHPDYWTMEDLKQVVSDTIDDEGFMELETVSAARDTSVSAQARSLKSRCATIFVTMVAVALGFECFETLMYAFVYSDNSPRMELTVLLARAFLPIHPICAAWQALGVCKRDVEKNPEFQMGRTILPAVLFHGLFDFLLLLLGFLDVTSNLVASIASGVVAVGMVLFGIGFIMHEHTKQQRRLERQPWIAMGSAEL